jgi:hypothetical protein
MQTGVKRIAAFISNELYMISMYQTKLRENGLGKKKETKKFGFIIERKELKNSFLHISY